MGVTEIILMKGKGGGGILEERRGREGADVAAWRPSAPNVSENGAFGTPV